MFFLRGRLCKFTFLIHAIDIRSEIRRMLEEIISEDSERNSDNSGNRPHTPVSGEQPSTSHLDVQRKSIYESDSSLYVLY
jgi:hypothetical protein